MANPNTPFGFRPTMRTFTGGSGTIQPTHKLAGYATALFINDAVTHAAAGTKPTLAVGCRDYPRHYPSVGRQPDLSSGLRCNRWRHHHGRGRNLPGTGRRHRRHLPGSSQPAKDFQHGDDRGQHRDPCLEALHFGDFGGHHQHAGSQDSRPGAGFGRRGGRLQARAPVGHDHGPV